MSKGNERGNGWEREGWRGGEDGGGWKEGVGHIKRGWRRRGYMGSGGGRPWGVVSIFKGGWKALETTDRGLYIFAADSTYARGTCILKQIVP